MQTHSADRLHVPLSCQFTFPLHTTYGREGPSVFCLHRMAPGFPGSSQFVTWKANLHYPNNIKSHFFNFDISSYNLGYSVHCYTHMHQGCKFSDSWELFHMKSGHSLWLVSEKRLVCAQGTALEFRTIGTSLSFIKDS